MANNCFNRVVIDCSETAADAIRESLRGWDQQLELEFKFDFDKLVPMPENIKNNPDYSIVKKWCGENWGSKWNGMDSTSEYKKGILEYRFTTAWSEPVPVIRKLSETYPDFLVTHYYLEEAYMLYGSRVYLEGSMILESIASLKELEEMFEFPENE